MIKYADEQPAADATLVFTDPSSGVHSDAVRTDQEGRFHARLTPGDYALAVTATRGALWAKSISVTEDTPPITLPSNCAIVRGRVAAPDIRGAQVNFGQHSVEIGDIFAAQAGPDGHFFACLPPGEYFVFLSGSVRSISQPLTVPFSGDLVLQGYRTDDIKTAPPPSDKVAHDMDLVVQDILKATPRIIGLGEASHGSAEFVQTRAQLTLELARRAGVRAVLLEIDAIAAFDLDRYANGENLDLQKAIESLQFWSTNTYEFIHFIQEVRKYNLNQAASHERIRIWGVDVQDTRNPAVFIGSHASTLGLSTTQKALLDHIATRRSKGIKELSREQRALLADLLTHLFTPVGRSEIDIRVAVAARSLSIQVGLVNASPGKYASERDAGMAHLATFIIGLTGVRHACIWAHDDHITRDKSGPSMGEHLTIATSGMYYPIGFFMFEGSSRAWDAALEVGVVSHSIRAAPPFTVEGALMDATGSPEVAWVPIRSLPTPLFSWLKTPRFVRELGALYFGEERSMILIDPAAAYDALVIIKNVHDSSPTPTGSPRPRRR